MSVLCGALAGELTYTLILCTLPTITNQREDAPALCLVPADPERKVQATRADMTTLRGLVQGIAGNLVGTEADWWLAWVVDPAHGPATELLQRLENQQ